LLLESAVTFPTKVDLWLGAILIGALIASAFGIFTLLAGGEWLMALIVLVLLGLTAMLIWPCEYVFFDDHLMIRSGVIKYRVAYADVASVRPTRNPLSAPAFSLDRLWIDAGKFQCMVSPKDQEGFLIELGVRARLKREGDKWVKKPAH
jgi:hypothetical protein